MINKKDHFLENFFYDYRSKDNKDKIYKLYE